MSDLRRLIAQMDRIDEVNAQSPLDYNNRIGPPPIEGGIGGGAGGGFGRSGIGSGISTAKPRIERLPGETPAQAVARAQSSLPAGVKPSTAGAGRGTVNPEPAGTWPPKAGGPKVWKDAGATQRKNAQLDKAMNEPVGPSSVSKTPPDKSKGLGKSLAGHAALGAALAYGGSKLGGSGGGGTTGEPEPGPTPIPVEPDTSATTAGQDASTTSTPIDVPSISAAGLPDNSPFYVVDRNKQPTTSVKPTANTDAGTPSTATTQTPVTPGKATAPTQAQQKPVEPQPAPVTPAVKPTPAEKPVVSTPPVQPTPAVKPTPTPAPDVSSPATGGQGGGTGTGTGTGSTAGQGSGQGGRTGSGQGTGVGGGTGSGSSGKVDIYKFLRGQDVIKEFEDFINKIK